MSYKIDVTNIIKDHIGSLVNAQTKKPDFRDMFFFLYLPIILSVILIYNGYLINVNTSNSLIAGLSIYVGLSINFLMLIFELSTKQYFKEAARISTLKQVIANISVTTIYSLFIIVLTLLAGIPSIKVYVHFILYLVLFEFLFTMLMVLKRIYNILIGTMSVDIHSDQKDE